MSIDVIKMLTAKDGSAFEYETHLIQTPFDFATPVLLIEAWGYKLNRTRKTIVTIHVTDDNDLPKCIFLLGETDINFNNILKCPTHGTLRVSKKVAAEEILKGFCTTIALTFFASLYAMLPEADKKKFKTWIESSPNIYVYSDRTRFKVDAADIAPGI